MKPVSRSTELLVTRSRWVVSRRYVHNSPLRKSTAPIGAPVSNMVSTIHTAAAKLPPLAVLPMKQVLRSYLITRATSSPILLRACFLIIKSMLRPGAVILSPERNPILRWLFKHTFYAQFCAGENKAEVQKTVANVKKVGYSGVILEYALELLKEDEMSVKQTPEEQMRVWREGMLETVDMATPGDFVALKWSGIGNEALDRLNKGLPPTPAMEKAILEVCDLAAKKDVYMIPGAELEVTNVGIDAWTIDLQRKYNKEKPGKALVFTTYQAYLRSTPARIARDLAIAEKENFTLGVKLVRGAYLASEPKDRVVSTKAETDAAYDGIVEALLRRTYNSVLKPAATDKKTTDFPQASLFICSHNAESVRKAREIRSHQAHHREPRIECAYAQLQGMADEISCGLVAAAKEGAAGALQADPNVDVPKPYKCATWGTVTQCLHFLYRRAAENQDAAGRTADTRRAMGLELWRRTKASVGIGA
jgi:Proline dehydrogenase